MAHVFTCGSLLVREGRGTCGCSCIMLVRMRTPTNQPTNQPTNPMEQSSLWDDCHSDGQEFPSFYVSRRFLTMFTRTLHWSLLCARWIQSITPHPFFHYNILSSTPLRFSENNFIRFSQPSHARFMLHQSHPPWFGHPSNCKKTLIRQRVTQCSCKNRWPYSVHLIKFNFQHLNV
jgi:hypothetical protein